MPEKSLKNKTIDGTIWTAAETVSRFGITFIVGIVLARLLSPDEYGLIGILTIFINFFNVLVDGGFINAIIRKKDAKDIDYCTVFYINLTVSSFLCFSLFLCAPYIAQYFERSELTNLTRVMSFAVLINGLGIVQKAKLTKAINFKSQTKISITASLVSGLVGIGMAIADLGVGQQITQLSVNMILLWISTKWVPKLCYSWASFKELWSFGWKLLVSGILESVSTEITHAVVGKYYSPISLGKYTRAQQFSQVVSGNITSIVQRVTYPVLSTIQDEPLRLKEAYRKVIKVTCLPTFISMLCLAAVSENMISVLIGDKWGECYIYLQLLCFNAMLMPLHVLNLNAIQAMGRSDLTLFIKITKTVIQIGPIVIGIFINIYWMLISNIFVGFISYYLNAYYSKTLLNYSIWEQIHDILPSLLMALLINIPVYFLSYINTNSLIIFCLQLISFVIWAIFILEKTRLEEYLNIKDILCAHLLKKRN